MFLSFCAAFFLPRQFHMMFTENISERSLLVAGWAFPLFLLLLNLFIPVILWAGTEVSPAANADFYVLSITLSGESRFLPALAFIGGVSAASAMMIVTSIALASMCLNHLLLPASYPDPGVNLYQWLLWGKRTLIAVIILAGYGFYLVLEQHQGLVQLGLISFVAVAQFLPGVVALLFWSRATRAGFIAGLSAGAIVWAVTLLGPLLHRSGLVTWELDLVGMLGLGDTDPWAFATFCSLGANTLLFAVVSLLTHPSDEEREAADACRMTPISLPLGVVVSASSPSEFEAQLARILGADTARHEVEQALADLEMAEDERSPNELRRLRERIERNLSGLMGPMLARMIVDQRLQMGEQTRSALADNIRFIEERVEQSRTELRGLAAQLDSLRRYHQEILSDLPVGACSLSSDARVISWNMAIESISGIPRQRARGKPLGKLPPPWGHLLHGFLEGEDLHQHKVSIMVDDRPRWLNLHKASIRQPGGTVILVEDLTDVQTLEAELAHSDRLASIGRLAAGVAHEIGNPVTGIACIAQNLKTESDDPETRDAIVQILGETERIRAIVQSLVGFSHGGSAVAQKRASIRLRDCIDEAARLVRLSHAGKRVIIENQCPADLTMLGDQPRLVQVFLNLLSNACDASTPGDKIHVNAGKTNQTVDVEIVDQGSGIANAVLDQVFEPFVTTKAPGQGTGLGLAMVYSIVQDHGGNVQVAETSSRGTRIVVELPTGAEDLIPPHFGQGAV